MSNPAEVERRILEADDARYKAMLAADEAVLADLLADDLVYTHSSALVDNKQQYLQSLREGRTRYISAERNNARIRLYGQVAVMHGHSIMQLQHQGQPKSLNNLFQSVWIQNDGRWQMASWASTVIPASGNTK